jgi:hypothetical protein
MTKKHESVFLPTVMNALSMLRIVMAVWIIILAGRPLIALAFVFLGAAAARFAMEATGAAHTPQPIINSHRPASRGLTTRCHR